MTAFAAAQEKTIYLDEMDLSKTTCGWKKTEANKTVDGAEPSICGRKFEHCVGHHAPGDILAKVSLDPVPDPRKPFPGRGENSNVHSLFSASLASAMLMVFVPRRRSSSA